MDHLCANLHTFQCALPVSAHHIPNTVRDKPFAMSRPQVKWLPRFSLKASWKQPRGYRTPQSVTSAHIPRVPFFCSFLFTKRTKAECYKVNPPVAQRAPPPHTTPQPHSVMQQRCQKAVLMLSGKLDLGARSSSTSLTFDWNWLQGDN
jgi:hypothetical protein